MNISFLSKILALATALTGSALAQPMDNLLFAAGTTIADSQNRQWSYLLWQTTDPELIKGRSFAVYAKPGDANSASSYQRQAVVQLATDPGVIQVLINRATNLGQLPFEIEDTLDQLFQKLMPPQGATLAEKLSIVIRSSLDTPEHFKKLMLLSRLHPAVSFCLGTAYAEQIPNAATVTYEIRQFEPNRNQDLAVVGRVTVKAGAPTVLPAPGAPVQVYDIPVTSAKGNLNAKFRWADPDPLRRLSLLSYGYNLYRVTTDYAEDHNFQNVPPGLGVLAQTAAQYSNNPTNPPVKRVNHAPVLKAKDFSAADVANFDTNTLGGDATTYFTHDDNNRYRPGGVPFENGEKFYYFAAARDILGRDGLTSPGTMVTMCDRLPPEAPRGVVVENDYSKQPNVAPKQVFRITWKQNTNSPTETHTYYYVYRWNNHSDSLKDGGDPLTNPNRVSGPIPHVPGEERLSFIDVGPGSPQMPQDAGKTFWYTVRVQDNGACGGNFSPHTGPVFGVLRDRTGPDAPTGTVGIQCCQPEVVTAASHDSSQPNLDSARAYYQATCDRSDSAIEWAEFYAFTIDQTNLIKRLYYMGTQARVSTEYSVPREQLNGKQMQFYCRVGSTAGKTSSFQPATAGMPNISTVREVRFIAHLDCNRVLLSPTGVPSCHTHEPNPDGTGTNGCTQLFLNLAAGTKEIKIYKRIDFGPLMLIEQGKTTNLQVQITDCVPVANAGSVCYFAQAYDENGNASALVPIGSCLEVSGTTPIGKPILSPISPAGSAASPEMTVTWFCPPYGVERFELSLAMEGTGTPPPQSLSAKLSKRVRIDPDVDFTIQGKQKEDDFAVYRTTLIGPNFGEGPKFQLPAGIEPGKTYYVYVRALGKDGSVSKRSNIEKFTWTEPPPPGPQVPWPTRALPPVGAMFNPGIIATNLPDEQYPVGVRIGGDLPFVGAPSKGNFMIPSYTNPLKYLYAKKDGSTTLPVALYRYQVPNAAFPDPSGDITQVSPLMEKIAFQQTTVAQFGPVTIIRDPFVGIYGRPSSPLTPPVYDLYLLDTQPIITGARYTYLLVRFGENHEIEEVLTTNEVDL